MIDTLDIIPITQKQPPRKTLNAGQIALYKYLQFTKSTGGKLERLEVLKLYIVHVASKRKLRRSGEIMYEEQLNAFATQWMNSSIAAYVSRGYVTLNFNVKADDIDKYQTPVNRSAWKI